MAKTTGKGTYLAAALLLLGGLGYLIFSGVDSGSVYFLNVSEAMAMDRAVLKQARLFGSVADNDLERREGAGVSFRLQDKDDAAKTIVVDYKGVVPDLFKPGAEVIVEGGFKGEVFAASTLMTKCPSKYQKENRG